MKRLEALFPWLVLLLAVGWAASKAVPRRVGPDEIDHAAFGQIPVRDNGRIMPLDTLARTTLQSLSGRTEVIDEHGKFVAPAVQWLAMIFDQPDRTYGAAADYKVFRIEHDQLLAALDLPRRPGFFRYSISEIEKNFDKLSSELAKVERKRAEERPLDLYDAKIEDLAKKLRTFQRLARTEGTQPVPPSAPSADWTSLRDVDLQVLQTLTEDDLKPIREQSVQRLKEMLIKRYGSPEKVPEDVAANLDRLIENYFREEVWQAAQRLRGRVNPAAGAFTELLRAVRRGDGEGFAQKIADYYDKHLTFADPSSLRAARLEAQVLGYLAPFYLCANLYILVGVLSALGWLVWQQPLNRAAFMLGLATLIFHTAALLVRMYVQGRPPVTNLYSSAVFIGWGAVALALGLEAFYRNGIGNAVAAAAGAASMQVAHFLGGSGDTMHNLVAVLDTNFWLATHVTTVTLGYTASFVAGFLAIFYILRGIFTPTLHPAAGKTLAQMIYGVICFATLLSFVGTVLGGIWADYSWGRFWGWDPKENGAVMIVLWNAMILHARWGGLVKARGMANLAVLGNIVTAWSWFGTNQLQIGLHSYGFDDRLAVGCRWFWISQLAIVLLGLLPVRYWRSYQANQNL